MKDTQPDHTQPLAVYSDVTFAIVPEWLLDVGTARAVHLYALLRRYGDASGQCFPTRTTLARRLRCSTDTVDRTVAELVALGACTVQPRHTADGRQRSSLYVVHVMPGGAAPMRPRGRTGAAGGAAPVRHVPIATYPTPPQPPASGGSTAEPYSCSRHRRPRTGCPGCAAGPPPPRPPWCGTCTEATRLLDSDHPRRCPTCHPLEVQPHA